MSSKVVNRKLVFLLYVRKHAKSLNLWFIGLRRQSGLYGNMVLPCPATVWTEKNEQRKRKNVYSNEKYLILQYLILQYLILQCLHT